VHITPSGFKNYVTMGWDDEPSELAFKYANPGTSGPAGGSSTTGFCTTHDCISNFDEGTGAIAQCADGTWSQSGGLSGACSGQNVRIQRRRISNQLVRCVP
jgi:hypothetical protein